MTFCKWNGPDRHSTLTQSHCWSETKTTGSKRWATLKSLQLIKLISNLRNLRIDCLGTTQRKWTFGEEHCRKVGHACSSSGALHRLGWKAHAVSFFRILFELWKCFQLRLKFVFLIRRRFTTKFDFKHHFFGTLFSPSVFTLFKMKRTSSPHNFMVVRTSNEQPVVLVEKV